MAQLLLIYCCFGNVEVDFMRVASAFTWKMIVNLLASICFELLVTKTCYDKKSSKAGKCIMTAPLFPSSILLQPFSGTIAMPPCAVSGSYSTLHYLKLMQFS